MRSLWSGTISFGLVSVPVRMVSATESKELRFHFLHKDDLTPIGYEKAEVDMAKSLVENLSDSFEPGKYDDRYRKELLDLIRAKAKGGKLPEPAQRKRARSST